MRGSLCVGVAVAAGPAALHAFSTFNSLPAAGPAGTCRARPPVFPQRHAVQRWRRDRSDWPLEVSSLPSRTRRLAVRSDALDENDTVGSSGGRSYPPLQHIPQTSLLVRDEATGCDIYLVGCLHGSHASGRDVRVVLDRVRPGAVVLELCESRHRSLRKDLEQRVTGDLPVKAKDSWQEEFRGWGRGIRRTMKKAGVLQGLLAAMLSAPYLVQRLGDFDPGLEFKTAMAYAETSSQYSGLSTGAGGGDCAVVLGDRDVQETLRRIGGALTAMTNREVPMDSGDTNAGEGRGDGGSHGGVAAEDAAAQAESLSDWAFVSDAQVVRMAMVGPKGYKWPDSLNVFDTIWRERQALGSLLLPLLFVLAVVIEALQRSIGSAASVALAATGAQSGNGRTALEVVGGSAHPDITRLFQTVGDVWDTAFVVFSVWYLLRFFRLVIKERDVVLAESIRKACRDRPGRPVVAVLGLLHCNGVADILRRRPARTGGECAAFD